MTCITFIRGQTKVVAANIKMGVRDKIRLDKHLKDHHLHKQASIQHQTTNKSVSPLRQRQQIEIDQKNLLKKKGMVGELSKIFLNQRDEDTKVDEDEERDRGEGEEEFNFDDDDYGNND